MSEVKQNKQNKKNKENNYDKPFPKLLRDMMSKYNVTQSELGQYINVTRQAISQYQNGETTPDIYTFEKIVEFFNKEKKVNYSYDFWLGNLKMKTEFKYSNPISFKELGISCLAYNNLFRFGYKSEKEAINLILENEDLIQLFQDYLGDEVRDDKNHLALLGAKETIGKLFGLGDLLDFDFSPDDLYDELKLSSITKELKKMRSKKEKKFNKSYKL